MADGKGHCPRSLFPFVNVIGANGTWVGKGNSVCKMFVVVLIRKVSPSLIGSVGLHWLCFSNA